MNLPSLLPRESTFRRFSLKSWKRLMSRTRSTLGAQWAGGTAAILTPPPPHTNITPEIKKICYFWWRNILFYRCKCNLINGLYILTMTDTQQTENVHKLKSTWINNQWNNVIFKLRHIFRSLIKLKLLFTLYVV